LIRAPEDGLLEEVGVLSNEALPFFRHVRLKKDSRHRAGGHASSAVNAGRWIYEHLLLCGATLNTVNGANIDARQFFGADARLTDNVGQTSRSAVASFLIIVGVNCREVLPLLGKIVFGEDRLYRTGRLASATVDAFIGMNVKKLGGFEFRLILARVNAIYGTHVHASGVLRPYAGFSDNVRHLNVSLLI
jgi:hypothetical protein